MASLRCACGHKNDSKRNHCERCGRSLSDAADAEDEDDTVGEQAAPSLPVDSESIICSATGCGEKNPLGSARCMYCGARLSALTPSGADEVPPTVGSTSSGNVADLPPEMADQYRVVRPLRDLSGRASATLIEATNSSARFVFKLYDPGVDASREVIDRVRQSDPDHVVKLQARGTWNGRYYELQEHVPLGSLEDLVNREGPKLADEGTVKDILKELGAAISHIHTNNIVHWELTPRNILVRERRPLDLILSEFAFASTEFGKSNHRQEPWSVAYSAPETLAGTVSSASNYWSLGIILVEVLTGRHPFRMQEASDPQQIRSWIATRPVDMVGVPGLWRKLCRGLLERDPEKRWKFEQIQRWLDNDDTLPEPSADSGEVRLGEFPPLALGRELFHIGPLDLPKLLAARWEDSKLALERGALLRWARDHVPDKVEGKHVLVSRLGQVEDERDLDWDAKLFCLITYLSPDQAPVYKGFGITREELEELSDKAYRGESERAAVVESIHGGRILGRYADITGKAEYKDIEDRWIIALREFEELRPQALAASGAQATALPTQQELLSRVLRGVLSARFVEDLRRVIAKSGDALACPWFQNLGDPTTAGLPRLIVLSALLPLAARTTAEKREAEAAAKRLRRDQLLASLRKPAIVVAGLVIVGFIWNQGSRQKETESVTDKVGAQQQAQSQRHAQQEVQSQRQVQEQAEADKRGQEIAARRQAEQELADQHRAEQAANAQRKSLWETEARSRYDSTQAEAQRVYAQALADAKNVQQRAQSQAQLEYRDTLAEAQKSLRLEQSAAEVKNHVAQRIAQKVPALQGAAQTSFQQEQGDAQAKFQQAQASAQARQQQSELDAATVHQKTQIDAQAVLRQAQAESQKRYQVERTTGLAHGDNAQTAVATLAPARQAESAERVPMAQDSQSGCKVWKPNLQPNESVTWSGDCADGYASGNGTARWSSVGKELLTYEGTFRAGVLQGKGVMTAAGGDRYEGNYKDGKRDGRGVYTTGAGHRYDGEFHENKKNGAGIATDANGVSTPVNFKDGQQVN